MEPIIREALSGSATVERYDAAESKVIFGRINESWEEMYAALFEGRDSGEDIPDDFLTGRRAFIFHMFYRVLVLHEEEARVIEARKREAAK
jgi:hypothetical protein